MEKHDEFWMIVASGQMDAFIGNMRAVSDQNTREALINRGALVGKLVENCLSAFGYVITGNAINLVLDSIADAIYNPHLRLDDDHMRVANAGEDGTTLTCDDPGEAWEVLVFQWNDPEFTEVGVLLDHSTPGPGIYVLVPRAKDRAMSIAAWGLPSEFLTLP